MAPGKLTLGVGVGGEDRHEVAVCGVDPATRRRWSRPKDAVPVDTTGLTLDEVVDQVVTLAIEAKEIEA